MSKDNNLFKGIEEKFLERQRAKRKVQGGPNELWRIKKTN